MSNKQDFRNDSGLERQVQPLFDQVYRIQWPEYIAVRFDDPNDKGHTELQFRGVDVALFRTLPKDPVSAVRAQLNGGKRVAILIDEKATESGGERPGLPIEVEHRWWGWQKRLGWVQDPKHSCEVIAYGCMSTKSVHLFLSNEVKTRWRECIDRSRRSQKVNQGLNPDDWWSTEAYYSDGFECFESHRCIEVA